MIRRSLRLAAAASILATVAACDDDDPAAPEEEPDIQSVTLTVGTSVVTINKTTGQPSGPLIVPAGASTVTAQWKRPDGSDETLVTSDEFELQFLPTNTAVLAWTASGAFGGTLTTTGLTSGMTTTAEVQLFHLEKQHEDFGKYPITIQIQ
jgi:hypothetical protein